MCHPKLVVMPYGATLTEETFLWRFAVETEVGRCLGVVVPDGDEALGEEKKEGVYEGFVFANEDI